MKDTVTEEATAPSRWDTDPDVITALETVSDFFTENTAHNRRNLSRQIENAKIESSERLLAAFGKVKNNVDTLSKNVDEISRICDLMTTRLSDTKARTRHLIGQTSALQQQRQTLERRQIVVEDFVKNYTLTDEEKFALLDNEDDVGTLSIDFFPALHRSRQVYARCRQLLESQPAGCDLAMELVEKTAHIQERAYERLYRFIQRECRLLAVDAVEVNSLLVDALHAMQMRPTLFKYSLDEYNTARKNHLVRAFIDALTRGTQHVKAIEHYSHDAARYTNDMLHWIVEACRREYTLLHNSLLKRCSAESVKEHAPTCMANLTDGLCRPLRMRVEQALAAENGPVVLHRLCNAAMTNEHKLASYLTIESNLLSAVAEIRQTAKHMFSTSLASHVQRTLTRMGEAPASLKAPEALSQVLLLLRDILQSGDNASPTHATTIEQKRQTAAKLYAAVLEPTQTAVLNSGTKLSPVKLAVYVLNCLNAVRQVIAVIEYSQSQLEALDAQIDTYEDLLVSEQTGAYLEQCQLSELYQTCVTRDAMRQRGEDTNNVPILAHIYAQDIVRKMMMKLNAVLADWQGRQLSELGCLSTHRVKETVDKRTKETFLHAYKVIHDNVTLPDSGFDAALVRDVLLTPDAVQIQLDKE